MRFLTFAAALTIPFGASAHVTVWPKESTAGAREKYEVRVPNEKQADTTSVEVRFPAGLSVTAFEQKPGWFTEAVTEAGKTVGVRWTGKLPPHQFTEFGLLAVNPAADRELVWTAVQTYADGTQVKWSGAAGSKTPAPRVVLKPPAK